MTRWTSGWMVTYNKKPVHFATSFIILTTIKVTDREILPHVRSILKIFQNEYISSRHRNSYDDHLAG